MGLWIAVPATLILVGAEKAKKYYPNYFQCFNVLQYEEYLTESIVPMQRYKLNTSPTSPELQETIKKIIQDQSDFKYIPNQDSGFVALNYKIFNASVDKYKSWTPQKQQQYWQTIKAFNTELLLGKNDFSDEENKTISSFAKWMSTIDMNVYASESEYKNSALYDIYAAASFVVIMFIFLGFLFFDNSKKRKNIE